jgi:hypothetical protein
MLVHFSPIRGGGGFCIRAILVTSPEAMRRGLSGRWHLPPDEGMLFDFGRDGMRTFWMRNTHVPLDLAFIGSDGVVTRVVLGAPPDRDDRYTANARWVLEVPSPWMVSHGPRVGFAMTLLT